MRKSPFLSGLWECDAPKIWGFWKDDSVFFLPRIGIPTGHAITGSVQGHCNMTPTAQIQVIVVISHCVVPSLLTNLPNI
jgi:hypothetical protein